MMENHGKKTAAFAAVALLAFAALIPAVMDDGRMMDESAAVAGLDDAFVAGFVIGMIAGAAIGASTAILLWNLIHSMKDLSEETSRAAEASAVRDILETADGFYLNALENYAQIWGYTSEHFERQAELAASMLWAENAQYDPESIMLYSGTYANSAMMLANAVVQINELYAKLSRRVANWQSDGVFANKMSMTWNYGSHNVGGSSWAGEALYSVNIPSGQAQKVYFAGGSLTIIGGSCGAEVGGNTVTLSDGVNRDLPAGVYTLQGGRSYASDRILPVIDVDAAEVRAALLMGEPGQQKLAYWENGNVVVDGIRCDNMGITVSPQGSPSVTVDITRELSARASLISAISDTVSSAGSAAAAVWKIFGDAGHASAYLTTLTVPDVYENVIMTKEQKAVMTVLSMKELSDYWQSSGGNVLKECRVSAGSNLLFVRGDIVDSAGRMIAENAVFTPYYMTNDQSISVGDNRQTQQAICAVWETGYSGSLSAWDGSAGMKSSLVETRPGYGFRIAEILYGGENMSSVDLDIMQIDYIKAQELKIAKPVPTPVKHKTSWITVAMGIIAVLLVFAGLIFKRWELVAIGAAVGVIGLFFGDEIQNVADRFGRLGGIL